jgi:hypothetical protein
MSRFCQLALRILDDDDQPLDATVVLQVNKMSLPPGSPAMPPIRLPTRGEQVGDLARIMDRVADESIAETERRRRGIK